MKALLGKELRSLLPFIGLLLLLYGLDLADILFDQYPDQTLPSKLLHWEQGAEGLRFALAFSLAAGLLVREHDEGTLAFLDGLPIARWQIFAAKVMAGLGLLWLTTAADLIEHLLLCACSRTSLDTHTLWPVLLNTALISAVSWFVYFSLGLALSFLRQFSWLVMGLLMSAYLFLDELKVAHLPLLNIFRLSEPTYHGYRYLLPTTQLLTQCALGLLCLALAYGGFLSLGDASRRLRDQVQRRPRLALFTGLATAAAVVIWSGLAIYGAEHSEPDNRKQVHYEDWPTVRARTSRYLFLYPVNLAATVQPWLEAADTTEGRVRAFLGATPISHIEADLTGSSPGHAGVAHWKKVNLEIRDFTEWGDDASSQQQRFQSILGHETAHVYIDHESQNRIGDDFNSTRFFHEGLASYLEYHLFLKTRLLELRRVAATMRARQEVKFEELLDNRVLSRKRDTDLVYPLGEVFVSALIERYGPEAPGKVVRAFARAAAPKGLKGYPLWQDVLQSCGYDLGAVEDTFYADLDRSAASQRPFIKKIPRLSGSVHSTMLEITVKVAGAHAEARELRCRFRPGAETPSTHYEYPNGGGEGEFCVKRSHYPHPTFWYQLGWKDRATSLPIWEPWLEAPTQSMSGGIRKR